MLIDSDVAAAAGPSDRLTRYLELCAVAAALATLPLTLIEAQGGATVFTIALLWVVWIVFLIEYATLFALARSRRAFVRGHLLELAVVMLTFPGWPTVLWLARLARLTRVLRSARLLVVGARLIPALQRTIGRKGLLYVGALTAVLIVFAGAAMVVVEPRTVKGDFADGVWWALATATTVGYGDISPSTVWGRVLAGLLMVSGIGLTATLAASIAAHFVGNDQADDAAAIHKRLDEIQASLEELKRVRLERRSQ